MTWIFNMDIHKMDIHLDIHHIHIHTYPIVAMDIHNIHGSKVSESQMFISKLGMILVRKLYSQRQKKSQRRKRVFLPLLSQLQQKFSPSHCFIIWIFLKKFNSIHCLGIGFKRFVDIELHNNSANLLQDQIFSFKMHGI